MEFIQFSPVGKTSTSNTNRINKKDLPFQSPPRQLSLKIISIINFPGYHNYYKTHNNHNSSRQGKTKTCIFIHT